jgi:hypothetical protein
MGLIKDIAIKSLTIGLIGALISMATSMYNGVGAAGGWVFALIVFLVAFVIVFWTTMSQTWREVHWMREHGYDATQMTTTEYLTAMDEMHNEQNKK